MLKINPIKDYVLVKALPGKPGYGVVVEFSDELINEPLWMGRQVTFDVGHLAESRIRFDKDLKLIKYKELTLLE